MEVLVVCQDFRKLVKMYLLSDDANSDNESDEQPEYLNDSWEEERKLRGQKIETAFDGMGILKFTSSSYVSDIEECQTKLQNLRSKFEKQMYTLTSQLNRLTKTQSGKIILSYLLEIL